MYKKVGSKLNVDKKQFYDEIKKSKEQDELTPGAVDIFIKMAEHGIRNGNLNYPQKIDEEDCIQSALCDCIKYWRNFDEKRFDNPFAFFTSIIFNGYAKEYKNVYKHRFIKCTKKFSESYGEKFSRKKIEETIDDIVSCGILTSIRRRDIFRTSVRLVSDCSPNWVEFTIGDYSFLDTPEVFGGPEVQFSEIDEVVVKVEYNSAEEFMSLNQSGDSEIYNI